MRRHKLAAMPKPWWVALPLLIAVAVLAVQWLRRRTPSRAGLNVGVSLLLLAYVAATAALGIFWVANQQLPVFDWHYLFGYATVALLALHLAFNLPVVWRVLTRRRGASTQAGAPARPSRRGWLAWAGAMLAAAAGYVVGLRHGSTELRVSAHAGANADAALAVVDAYHRHSAHSRTAALRRTAGDWGAAPPAFKRGARASPLTLPAPGRTEAAAFDARTLGALLWHAAGVSERRGTLHLRCAPSAGALFATELYVVVRDWPGVPPAVWHHDASSHALERLRDGAMADFAAAGLDADAAGGVAALVVATAVFARSGHKYRDRTYRYVLADLGHVLENLRAAAHALGVRIELPRHFDEAGLAAMIGVDESDEGVLALAVLRRADAPAHGVAPGIGWRVPPLADAASAAALPALTAAVHRATSLRRDVPPAAPAASASRGVHARDHDREGAETRALPAPEAPAPDALAAIARRRSVRRYRRDALPLHTLSSLLAGCASVPALLSGAVRIDVLAHAVESLPAASWRYRAAAHVLVRRTAPRAALHERARAAALGQDVIGDAAAVLVLSIDRHVWADETAGAARGWRLAFVEAGLVGERAYLHGGALGLGMCGVGAFYDDEIAALAGVDAPRESVVHLVALGVPA